MLTPVTDGLWVEAAPHAFYGLRIGTRMTLVRLGDGQLLLHSPIAITPERRQAVDALGVLAHVIAPNTFHHVFASEWANAYPKATMHAPAELGKKRPDLRIDRPLSDPPHAEWNGTLLPVPIEGTMLHETLFVHTPSRTLVSSDLVENQQRVDHFVTRTYLKLSSAYQRVAWPTPLRIVYRDRKAARKSIDRLLELDFDRAIVAHGDIIESGAREAISKALDFVR